ncbi:UNVERIFIED_CONTAM: hypothetical protein K2H54_057453 [Gekko kuhli]
MHGTHNKTSCSRLEGDNAPGSAAAQSRRGSIRLAQIVEHMRKQCSADQFLKREQNLELNNWDLFSSMFSYPFPSPGHQNGRSLTQQDRLSKKSRMDGEKPKTWLCVS